MVATSLLWLAFALVTLVHQIPFGYCYDFNSDKDENNQPSSFLSQGYPLTGKSTGPNGRLPYALLTLYTKGPDSKPIKLNFETDLMTAEIRTEGNTTLSILLDIARKTGFASSEQELIFWKCIMMEAYLLAKTVLQVADYELIKKLNEHLGPLREGIPIPPPVVLTKADGVEKDITIEGIHGTFVGDRWDASKTWIATCSALRKFESIPNLKTDLIKICSDQSKLPIRFLNGTEGAWGYADGKGKNLLGRIMQFVGEKLKNDATYQELVNNGFVEFRTK